MIATKSKHQISLDEAKKMTKKFRDEKKKVLNKEFHGKHVLPTCETFSRDGFDALLAQPGCVGVRAYYAMDEELGVHLVIVGVNEKNEDILPSETMAARSLDDSNTTSTIEAVILDKASRCPTDCPPSSTLNTE